MLRLLVCENVVYQDESLEIISNLRHLSERGLLIPNLPPKLLNQEEAAAMLGIGKSSLKKLESEGKLPIKRKMVGTSVRYRNTDILQFILSDEEEDENDN
jgi:predicted DNA-binding transcriptional regulator AlpA